MKDMHKNMLVMVIGVILITVFCHYTNLSMLTFPITIVLIVVWLIVSPFKFEENER
jgi:uncharacterized membrane protein